MTGLFIFVACFLGTVLGGLAVNICIDLWAQWDDNKFRRAVGLETKAVTIRRIK